VQRLRCRHEIDRGLGQGERLGARDRVFDSAVSDGALDLLFARIGGDDARKMFAQSDRSLSIAGATVGSCAVLSRQCRQMREQRFWI